MTQPDPAVVRAHAAALIRAHGSAAAARKSGIAENTLTRIASGAGVRESTLFTAAVKLGLLSAPQPVALAETPDIRA